MLAIFLVPVLTALVLAGIDLETRARRAAAKPGGLVFRGSLWLRVVCLLVIVGLGGDDIALLATGYAKPMEWLCWLSLFFFVSMGIAEWPATIVITDKDVQRHWLWERPNKISWSEVSALWGSKEYVEVIARDGRSIRFEYNVDRRRFEDEAKRRSHLTVIGPPRIHPAIEDFSGKFPLLFLGFVVIISVGFGLMLATQAPVYAVLGIIVALVALMLPGIERRIIPGPFKRLARYAADEPVDSETEALVQQLLTSAEYQHLHRLLFTALTGASVVMSIVVLSLERPTSLKAIDDIAWAAIAWLFWVFPLAAILQVARQRFLYNHFRKRLLLSAASCFNSS